MLMLETAHPAHLPLNPDTVPFRSMRDLLLHLAESGVRGTLVLSPNGTRLHLRGGTLEAVENFEPLGRILLRHEVLDEDTLARILAQKGPLGEDLLAEGLVSERQLRRALLEQARLGLSYALRVPPHKCALLGPEPLPMVGAGLLLTPERLEALFLEEVLPLEQPLGLAQTTGALSLGAQDWALLRCINGRRTLLSAMRLSGLEAGQAEAVAHRLFALGLLQASSVSSSKLIVLARKAVSASYHPPSSIMSNLFLKAIRDDRTVWEIAALLRISPEQGCSLAADLYRSNLLEVVRGRREMELLLEEF